MLLLFKLRSIGLMSLLTFSTFTYANYSWHLNYVAKQNAVKHGKTVYEQHCLGCHGEKGDGKGPAAQFLDPRPRDFTKGIFKFKTTEWDALPTNKDLFKTITQGILGTSMPGFQLVSTRSRNAVIEYIKTFSPKRWGDKELLKYPVKTVSFDREEFKDHSKFIERAKKGREVFKENCTTCHGRRGIAQKDNVDILEDDWGNKLYPADLTLPYIKSGNSLKDIIRTASLGLAGTPMMGFKNSIEDDDIVNVSAYILYLRGVKAKIYGHNPPIKEIAQEELE